MIDIIIPAYNARDVLPRCLASIATQDIINDCCITIIDDGSKYRYDKIVEKFSNQMNIRIVRLEENLGPGGARQEGLNRATGEFIVFIDAGNTFANAFSLSYLRGQLLSNPSVPAIFSSFLEELDKPGEFSLHSQDKTWMFGKMYRTKFLKEKDIQFPSFRQNEDHIFNLMVMSLAKMIILSDTITYFWHKNENSLTSNEDYNFNAWEGLLKGAVFAQEYLETQEYDKEAFILGLLSIFYNLYFSYSFLKEKYAPEKMEQLIKWIRFFYTKTIKNYNLLYDNYQETLSLVIKKGLEENHFLLPILSFQDFLNLIEEKEEN